MRRLPPSLLCWLALTLAASAAAQPAAFQPHVGAMPGGMEQGYGLRTLTEALLLPVEVIPLGDGRLLVAQLEGLAMVVHPDGSIEPEPFLDLREPVTALIGEQGMYSLALESSERARLHGRPRQLVAAYTERDSGDLVVAAYPTDAALSGADWRLGVELLRVPMAEPFHHGGQVLFGPDGMLYVSVGEGHRSPELLEAPPFTAQRLDTWNGKVLRIDPLPHADASPAYLIPLDNPYLLAWEALPEIWAIGLRNPWKMDLDPISGRILVADVGEDRWEEVSLLQAGVNLGWPYREGRECLELPFESRLVDPGCPERGGLTGPLLSIGHLVIDPMGGQSVTGGAFAYDPELPRLWGHYVFGDFVSGRVWAYDPASGEVRLLLEGLYGLTEVAGDGEGGIWLLTVGGRLARLVYTDGD